MKTKAGNVVMFVIPQISLKSSGLSSECVLFRLTGVGRLEVEWLYLIMQLPSDETGH